jgi:uncharacterized membrane protein YgcG
MSSDDRTYQPAMPATKGVLMRTHVDRICVALPAAAVFCVAALSAGPARAFPPRPTPIMRVPAGTYPAARGFAPPQRFIAAPPQRVIVIYRNGPPGSRGGGATAGASGASAGNNGGGSSTGSGGGNSGGGNGGSVGDVFKQALGDFAKSAIDGLLKLPSK